MAISWRLFGKPLPVNDYSGFAANSPCFGLSESANRGGQPSGDWQVGRFGNLAAVSAGSGLTGPHSNRRSNPESDIDIRLCRPNFHLGSPSRIV